jgi:hypothetical protein
MRMARGSLYFAVTALAVLVVGMACYLVYQDTQKPGLESRVDQQGIRIDGNC